MKHRDYLWCAVNLLLDEEEALAELCPGCRARAGEASCPACGAPCGSHQGGENAAFDLDRFWAMKGGEAP